MHEDENKVTYFAQTDSRGKKTPFGIKRKDRSRHTYVIGKTGMGKSTILENMAVQDIQNGEGIAFIDPHGKTAELLLEYIPEHRIKDVLYFAPFDMEYPVSFNVMEDVGMDKRHLVANGLMSTFEKIWVDAWSARMAYILNNTILALLEYPGSTLLGVNKMLSDKEYRKKVVENISDVAVKSFWIDEFGKYTEKFAAEATPAIQNKVGQFTSNPLIRNIIGQSKSTFDIRKMMDEKKILIINLSKGLVGEGNANLLGSMLITKIYLAAMSRADVPEAELKKLPNFYLYVDEFQSFANKSFADILSEARKYKLNLTIAHQYIEQMEEEVRHAVFGNVGTMVSFRVGAYDSEVLEKEFAPQFTGEDMVNLGIYQIYLKLMIDGVSSSPFSATTLPPIKKPEIIVKPQVIESSRAQFAHTRAQAEAMILENMTVKKPEVAVKNPGAIGTYASAPANSPNKPPVPQATSVSAASTMPSRTPDVQVKKNPQPISTPTPVSTPTPARTPTLASTPTQARPTVASPAPISKPQIAVSQSPIPASNSIPMPVSNAVAKNLSGQAAQKPSTPFSISPVPPRPPVSPISLIELQKSVAKPHSKERSPENINALKQALSAVLKGSKNDIMQKAPEKPSEKVHEKTQGKPVEKVEEKLKSHSATKNDEVPEDVLKKMLKVE